MHRDQPPCNTCARHDCRTCAWTSPLDASYRNFIHSQSLLTLFAMSVTRREQMPAEPSWFVLAGKRIAKFFANATVRAR